MKNSFRKILFIIIIPIFFISFAYFLSLKSYYSNDSSFFILKQVENKNSFINYNSKEILKGEKIKGKFKAKYNNLGILNIRFNTFNRINDDYLVFKIKEENSKNWYYQNKYKVDQFQPDQFFTFGFPMISNSKGNNYVFEIISTKGIHGDAVALSNIAPVVSPEFIYSRTALLHNPMELYSFIFHKFVYVLINPLFIFTLLFYLIPLLIYLLWFLGLGSLYRKFLPLSLLPVFTILLHLILVAKFDTIFFLILIIFWLFTVIRYNLDSDISFIFASFFIILSFIIYYTDSKSLSDRLIVWSFMFMSFGIIESIIVINNRNNKLTDINNYISEMMRDLKLK